VAQSRAGRSADRAALHIRRQIFDGRLRPGTRVAQATIADELGISRIPVREALIGLEREGWVTMEPNRGATVNAMSPTSVRDHFELYGMTYGLAVRRAVEHGAGPELAAAMRAIVRDFAPDDPPAFTRQAFAFHRLVVDAARSDRIPLVLQALSTILPGDFFSMVPAGISIERAGLRRIASAVAAGDADRAANEYLVTMRRVGTLVVGLFDERGLLR
jgi:DNA-binding GntR family transcriptional regulator